MKQLDIFGNEVDVDKLNKEAKKQKFNRLSIKSLFRRMHGYDKSNYCNNCIFCICITNRNINYYKCEKMGLSHSKATDIRLKDYACDLFERKEDWQTLIESKDINIGNKFIGKMNNHVMTIYDIYKDQGGYTWIKLIDEKGKKYEFSKEYFKHNLLYKKIEGNSKQ